MKNFSIEIKWAIIFILVQLAWMISENLLGFHGENIDQHPIVTNFFAIPAILIFVLALLDKRKNMLSGTMSYKEGFLTGLKISLIITAITPLTIYIIHDVISPEYFANAIEYSVSSGQTSREDAESYFNFGNYMLQGTIGALLMGIVTSAIIAIFVKKKPKD